MISVFASMNQTSLTIIKSTLYNLYTRILALYPCIQYRDYFVYDSSDYCFHSIQPNPHPYKPPTPTSNNSPPLYFCLSFERRRYQNSAFNLLLLLILIRDLETPSSFPYITLMFSFDNLMLLVSLYRLVATTAMDSLRLYGHVIPTNNGQTLEHLSDRLITVGQYN